MKKINLFLALFGVLGGAGQVFGYPRQKPCQHSTVVNQAAYAQNPKPCPQPPIKYKVEEGQTYAQDCVETEHGRAFSVWYPYYEQKPATQESTEKAKPIIKPCKTLPQEIRTTGYLLNLTCHNDQVDAFETQVKNMSLPQDPTDTPHYLTSAEGELAYDQDSNDYWRQREMRKNMRSPEFGKLYTKFLASPDKTTAIKIKKLARNKPNKPCV